MKKGVNEKRLVGRKVIEVERLLRTSRQLPRNRTAASAGSGPHRASSPSGPSILGRRAGGRLLMLSNERAS
jgi:hypothetical protein